MESCKGENEKGCGCNEVKTEEKTPETGLVQKTEASRKRRIVRQQIPDEILSDATLNSAINVLPQNYNFEVHKTIWRIRQANAKKVALQFPDGLLMYSCVLSDIVSQFTGAEVVILGDVTYGACCIDDITAKSLECDFLVHYGHSCLVPVTVTKLETLYVFVEIRIDVDHLVSCIQASFEPSSSIAVMGTIQFASAVHQAAQKLKDIFQSVTVPQAKPLSPGETLGCTSPIIPNCEILIFVADGRFHLEAAMIQNPSIQAFRYDPFSKLLTRESYAHEEMHSLRRDAILRASSAHVFCVILGTLGRQGNPHILDRITELLKIHNKQFFVILLSELFPAKLNLFEQVDAFVQIACPRLSIDWGHAFSKPLLSPYELQVTLGEIEWKEVYPMDYYSKEGGNWTNGFEQRTR